MHRVPVKSEYFVYKVSSVYTEKNLYENVYENACLQKQKM